VPAEVLAVTRSTTISAVVPSALAAAASLLSLAFALSTLERWVERRRRHNLMWTIALSLFAAASAAQWTGAAIGWGPLSFRLFYLLGPILSVPFLALGTAYLLGDRRRTDVIAAITALVGAFATGVVLVAPLTGPIDPDVLPQGSEVFGPLPRVLAASLSAGGAMVLIGGALWSVVRLARRRADRRLVAANGLIALGAIALSAAGLLNSLVGEMEAFSIAHVVGISLVFAGFLVTNPRPRAALLARPEGRSGLRSVGSAEGPPQHLAG
jgi:hypothetical protein